MPEIINLREVERRLARVLSRGLSAEGDKLISFLGDPPDLGKVPAEYWQTGWKYIQKEAEPILVDVFVQQAQVAMENYGIGPSDWIVIINDAADWAREHLDNELQRLFNRNYEGVSRLVSKYYENGMSRMELIAELDKIYKNPVRSEMIAITETTRAAVGGENALVKEIEKESNIHLIPIWMTDRSGHVCPDCLARDNLPITDGIEPPLHPRCNCRVRHDWESELNDKQRALWTSR